MTKHTRNTLDQGVNRRGFLVGAGAVGAAVTMGWTTVLPGAALAEASAIISPSIFFDIHGDNRVVVHIAKSEMGQHVGTALAQILAEELEADWDTVSIDYVGYDPRHGLHVTGGSWSVNWTFDALSRAGAAGRIALIDAAAAKFGGTAADYIASKGIITGNGHSITYGQLVASGIETRLFTDDDLKAITLKDPAKRTLVGRDIPALDIPAKTNGTAHFGIDAHIDGMLVATPITPPVRAGASVKSVDDSAAKGIKGYHSYLVLDNPVVGHDGVVLAIGTGYWAAKQAAEAIAVEYDLGGNAKATLSGIHAESERLIATGEAERIFVKEGDADAVLASAETKISATYSTGINIHAPLEPLNCTVNIVDGVVHVYSGNQFQTLMAGTLGALGVTEDKLVFHQHLLGGGFGRRLDPDAVVMATIAAQTLGQAVKVVYSREFDTQMDYTRPASTMQMQAGLSGGKIGAWRASAASASASLRQLPAFMAPDLSGNEENKLDPFAVNGADHWYTIENQKVLLSLNEVAQAATPSGHLRGVGPSWQFFAVESFMDEVAHAAGKDPLEFRLSMLDGAGKNAGSGAQEGGALRLAAVLKDVASRSGYGSPLPANQGIGLACVTAQERTTATWVACAAQVKVDPSSGEFEVIKLTLGIEVGTAINPNGIRAQVEGSAMWGLSIATLEDVGMEDGALTASNYDGITPARMENLPILDISIHETGQYPVGAGEPAVSVVGPAIANAIANAVGARVRSLPITAEKVKAALNT
jgi:isoquinoline 1-oxidoreductase beta subunit